MSFRQAIADEARWGILSLLRGGEPLRFSVIEERTHISSARLSYHLDYLVKEGLITRRDLNGMVFYQIEPEVWDQGLREIQGNPEGEGD